jgi:hypothetical protein
MDRSLLQRLRRTNKFLVATTFLIPLCSVFALEDLSFGWQMSTFYLSCLAMIAILSVVIRCPRCRASIHWYPKPFGPIRVFSMHVPQTCPKCGVDFAS